MNIVQKFDFGEGKARYELISNDKKNLHHHFICAKCRKITNYDTFLQEEEELIKKMREVFLKKHNFKIDNHIIYFHGICDNCSKEE
jgi:Fur family ferric uptake transcriptional regulator